MLLSKLVFLSVKNVIYLDDTSFNYEGFINGDFDNDVDYATNINNVFSPLNEAIGRLSDLERIPYIVEEVFSETYYQIWQYKEYYFYPGIYKTREEAEKAIADNNYTFAMVKERKQRSNENIIDLSKLSRAVRRVINVGAVNSSGDYRKLGHVMFGKNKVRITSPISSFEEIFIEYKENIPSFSRMDIVPLEEDGIVDNNIDLFEEYGIDEQMSNYIMEYVQGKLLEPLAPELANMHITRAEAYFNNIGTVQSSFPQASTEHKYRIGE